MTVEEKVKYLSGRIGSEFKQAVKDYKESELLIYLMIIECLNKRHDVSVELDSNNPLCTFFEQWNLQKHFDNNAMSFISDTNGKGVLSCQFDLYKLRDLFDEIESEMFGTLDTQYVEDLLDGKNFEITDDRLNELGASIKLTEPRPTVKNEEKETN